MTKGGWVYFMSTGPNGVLYVGVAADLVRRVFEHRQGVVEGFTKRHGLKRLVYFERHEEILEAIAREKVIKHWTRAQKVRLLAKDNPGWDDLWERILG
jgi:putative endonuclease